MNYKTMTIALLITMSILACTISPAPSDSLTPIPVTSMPDHGQGSKTTEPLLLANPNALIQPSDLEYLGAFRLPDDSGSSNWEYSGRGLTYHPGGDPGGFADSCPGSLFGVGHDQQQHVSEISIPAPVNSKNLYDLPTAITLQPFVDLTRNMFHQESSDLPRLGIEYLPPQAGQSTAKLHFTWGRHFQDYEASHGWSELNLANPQPAGPWSINSFTNYATNDYIFEISEEWAAAHTPGLRLATGRFREGVWGGGGPALFAIGPWTEGNPPVRNAKLAAVTPLLLYGIQEPGASEIATDASMQMDGYLSADHWWDGAWLTSGDKAAVAFIGTKALGNSWYGFANGVIWDYDCAEQDPPNCPDPPEWPYDNRGYWADDYQAQLIFYNPDDLAAVARGEVHTWEPQPYAVLNLTDHLFYPILRHEDYKRDIVGAMAFDRANGLLYIIERLADEAKSVIHVWRIRH